MKRRSSMAVVVACVSSLVAGGEGVRGESQAPPAAMPDMVISANRYETPAADVGSSISVISAAEIARSKLPTALELLRTVPGVEVSQSGGPGRIADVFVRGGSSSQTLVLIDGVRVNAATLGAFDFASLSADDIERIEVLRGPQSTLYGSEAMGGVIQIITKHGAPGSGGSARVEAGSPEQGFGTAEVHGGTAAADYTVSASMQHNDGLSAASRRNGATEKDRFDNAAAAGRFGFVFLDDGRADLTFRYYRSWIDLDGFTNGIGPVDDLNATEDREGLATSATVHKPLFKWWEQRFTAGLFDERIEGHDPDTEFNRYTINNRNVDVQEQSDFHPADGHILSAGYEFENRHGDEAGSFDKTATLNSVFAQEQWQPVDDLRLTGGARLDDHSVFGSETTYRGTVSWKIPGTALRAHSSAGTGFKAPTLSDLYFPGFGNPNLKAEKSVGYDAGLATALLDDRLQLDATLFRNDFNNLISYDATTFEAENVAKAMAQGIELSGGVQVLTNLHLSASYTYTDSEDKSTGEPLARRPKHRGTVEVAFQPVARVTTAATLIAVNDRIDSDGAKMDNYERLDLSLEYALNDHVYPYVRIENALDQDYEEVNGFTSPGFTGIGGVRATW